VDELDAKLIGALEIDARLTYADLARRLHISRKTVARRVQRLFDERIITSVTVADPFALGYRVRAGLCVNVPPHKVEAVAQQLAAFRCIAHVIITSGRYDIVAWGFFRGQWDMVDFISEKLGAVSDITNTETLIFLRFYKDTWAYSGYHRPISWQDDRECPTHIDDVDLSLIRELELEPRKSIADIGRSLGLNRNYVYRELKRLRDEGVLKVIGLTRPSALGLNEITLFLVKVHPSRIMAVAEQSSRHPSIVHVNIVSGNFGISMAGVFHDSKEMYVFVTEELGKMPGVISCESMHIAKFVKLSYSLVA